MSSSSIPSLTDVLFYTDSDTYNYQTDNRPLYQLDSNIKSIAASLVGAGYGEHSAINGGLLTPGTGVELLSNGQIQYPSSGATVLGLVIGATSTGLNKVIWGSTHLDLDAIGLSNLFPSATAGAYIVATLTTGELVLKTSISVYDKVVGQIKDSTYISVGTSNTSSALSDNTPAVNAHNLYGVSRLRNLILLEALDSAPVQFTKNTYRQRDIGTVQGQINPLNIALSGSTISAPLISGVPATLATIYPDQTAVSSWIIKETYSRFPNNATANGNVMYGSNTSSWATDAYANPLTGDISGSFTNYELATLGAGYDYSSTPALTDLFKQFTVSKYYSYSLAIGTLAFGKPTAILTVFDPLGIGQGGEISKIIICDFMSYNLTTGEEQTKTRLVLTGAIATALYLDTNVFTNNLTSLFS